MEDRNGKQKAIENRSNSKQLMTAGPAPAVGNGAAGRRKKRKRGTTDLEKRVPQSQRYSRVPQVLECAFQSDCTA